MKIRTTARKQGLLGLALLIMTLMTLPALAQPGRGMRGKWGPEARGGHGGYLASQFLLRPNIQKELGLSADQVGKIEKLDYDTKKEAIQMKAQLAEARLDLQQLIKADQPDRTKVMSQIDAVGKLNIEQRKADVNRLLDLKSILTPEQQAKAKQMLGERRNEFREKFAERRAEMREGHQGARPARMGRHAGPPPAGAPAPAPPQAQ
jgi:Spy/CpxP family protein refolding chaperone